jgi:hypothetical protein
MCCFTPGERAPSTHWIGWVGPRAGVDAVKRNMFPLPVIEPQPSSRRYPDWAIPTPTGRLKWGFVFDERRGLTTTGHSPSAGGDSSWHSLPLIETSSVNRPTLTSIKLAGQVLMYAYIFLIKCNPNPINVSGDATDRIFILGQPRVCFLVECTLFLHWYHLRISYISYLVHEATPVC